MAEDQDQKHKNNWWWKDQPAFPIYKKFEGTQWFKIVDPEMVFSIRDDAKVSAVGVSGLPIGGMVEKILTYDECTREEFNAALARIMDMIEPFLIDIMFSRDR